MNTKTQLTDDTAPGTVAASSSGASSQAHTVCSRTSRQVWVGSTAAQVRTSSCSRRYSTALSAAAKLALSTGSLGAPLQ